MVDIACQLMHDVDPCTTIICNSYPLAWKGCCIPTCNGRFMCVLGTCACMCDSIITDFDAHMSLLEFITTTVTVTIIIL